MAEKISQTLLEYAAPLLAQLPPETPLQQRQALLQIVMSVWNAMVVAQWTQRDVLPDLYRQLETMPPPGHAQMRAWVDALVERKRQYFADDLRAVGHWELRMKPSGEVSLWAEARSPPR
ncbi:hypothetical protein [Stigmatella aurantiaca]|uniref:Conserved uncharacterized protein n=1 Tax=Stigmatella aurantiaca (strain DW4/3-1) TaxID=378806 RepID=Q092M4_STIAD|nr:hypothetical protein [Stigmatella aurantiaca]ADO70766.1 conserved uncharacterized protein [Stigmatella aurantiaca DW4/3-1]EAU66718.1 hypothetical protein STIAU_4291 [Stigmatella aurantiaca DW4/3-1]